MAGEEPRREVISRKAAIRTGLQLYFTGVECRNGHIDHRYISSGCRSCIKMRAEKWRVERAEHRVLMDIKWRAENKEHLAAKGRRYRESGATKRAWANRDVEAEKARTRKYREANREKLSSYQKNWRRENKEKKMASNRNYKARRHANGGTHSSKDVLDILKSQKRKCGYCRTKLGRLYHVDHIIALVNGGSNARGNLQILCEPCNLRKGAMHPLDYARTLGLLL